MLEGGGIEMVDRGEERKGERMRVLLMQLRCPLHLLVSTCSMLLIRSDENLEGASAVKEPKKREGEGVK